jgi:hypothetical protein
MCNYCAGTSGGGRRLAEGTNTEMEAFDKLALEQFIQPIESQCSTAFQQLHKSLDGDEQQCLGSELSSQPCTAFLLVQ